MFFRAKFDPPPPGKKGRERERAKGRKEKRRERGRRRLQSPLGREGRRKRRSRRKSCLLRQIRIEREKDKIHHSTAVECVHKNCLRQPKRFLS